MATPAFEMPWDTIEVVDTGVYDDVRWLTASANLWGAINGYVKVPSWHPWFRLNYRHIAVDVHGGLTYGCNDRGWIGFDTLHYRDYWPGMPVTSDKSIHWTAADVAKHTVDLAAKVVKHAEETLAAIPPGMEDMADELLATELRARWNLLRVIQGRAPDPAWVVEQAELLNHGWGPYLRRLEREMRKLR